MAGIIIDEGLPSRMAMFYGNSTGRTPDSLRLYTAISPALSKASVLADFTQIVPGTMGYAAKAMAGGDWSFALDTTNHWCIGTANYAWTFTAGAGLTILGYYFLNTVGAKVFVAEQFSSPVVIAAGGGSLALTLSDKYKDCV